MTTTRTERSALIRPAPGGRRAAFTLTELLVAIGIIAVLAALTAISIRGVAKDARLASSRNTVAAVLDNARALAMKENRLVMVVFRPRWDGPKKVYVELVTAQWTGESAINYNPQYGADGYYPVVDRFIPVPDIPARRLSTGIKVAGPRYAETDDTQFRDDVWTTQVHLPGIDQSAGGGQTSEAPGSMMAVLYGPDGATCTANSASDSNLMFVDFNLDRFQRAYASTVPPPGNYHDYTYSGGDAPYMYFDQFFVNDEPYVTIVPFLAVYDDDEARELRATNWTDQSDYEAELVGPNGYITAHADRLHFNRYTGVAMK
jgi:prepilin-type N-terminal cleavage/methylation domain-containing protein